MTKEEFDKLGITDKDIIGVICNYHKTVGRVCPRNLLSIWNKEKSTKGFYFYVSAPDPCKDKFKNTLTIIENYTFLPFEDITIEIIKKDFWT